MAQVSVKKREEEPSYLVQPRRPIEFTSDELTESVNGVGNQLVKMQDDITAIYSLGAQADLARRAIYAINQNGEADFEKQLARRVFGSPAACGVAGGLIGIIGGPPGVFLGASIGLGVGTALGAGSAAHLKSTHYNNWLKRFGSETARELMQFFADTPALQAFLCPISGAIIKNPVRTPDGQVYEESCLSDSIIKFGRNPGTNENLTKDQCTPDYAYMGELSVALRCLIDVAKTQVSSPVLLKAFEALSKDLSQKIEAAYQDVQNKLNYLVTTGKIVPQIRKLALDEVNDLLFVEIPQKFRDNPAAYFQQSKQQVQDAITVVGYESAVRASLEPPKFVPGDRKEGDGVTDSGMGLGLPAPATAGPGPAVDAVSNSAHRFELQCVVSINDLSTSREYYEGTRKLAAAGAGAIAI